MVLELFAVVGHEDDERTIVETALLELLDEAAELLVAVRDLAVVLRDQTVAVERLLEVVARVLARVIGGRVRLVLLVERRGRRVGDVRIHRVHVQEAREAAALLEPAQAGVHDRARFDDLRGPVARAVQACEEVESLVEVRPRGVDDGVRDGGAGREPVCLHHLRQRDEAGIEAVAELDGAMTAGQQRRHQGGDGRLGPRCRRDRLVEDDGVLREGHELGRGVARISVGRGVIGAQRVHEVDDRDGRAVVGHGDPGIPPEGLAGIVVLLEAARLEHQLASAAGLGREVQIHGHPLPMGGPGKGIQEARPDRLFLALPDHLDHELDAGLVVALRGDAAGKAQARASGDVHRESIPAGWGGVEGGADDVVDADALACLSLDPGGVAATDLRLAPRLAGAQQIQRLGRRGTGGGGAADDDEGQTDAPTNPQPASWRRRVRGAKIPVLA